MWIINSTCKKEESEKKKNLSAFLNGARYQKLFYYYLTNILFCPKACKKNVFSKFRLCIIQQDFHNMFSFFLNYLTKSGSGHFGFSRFIGLIMWMASA